VAACAVIFRPRATGSRVEPCAVIFRPRTTGSRVEPCALGTISAGFCTFEPNSAPIEAIRKNGPISWIDRGAGGSYGREKALKRIQR